MVLSKATYIAFNVYIQVLLSLDLLLFELQESPSYIDIFFAFNKCNTLHSHLHFITKAPITFTFMLLTLLSKATYIVFKVSIWSVHAFPGNQTHDLGIALSYMKAIYAFNT